MEEITVGYALTGSFCTLDKSVACMRELKEKGLRVIPIVSQAVAETDTRFGLAQTWLNTIEDICGENIIFTIAQAEPIGPKKLLDLLVVSPCTGNTLGKLAAGIYDTSVTMAVKAHLRNRRPVLIGVSTNDALTGSAKSIGALMNSKNYYFIPMRQDDPYKKPFSVVADFTKTYDAVMSALQGEQIQPMLS